MNHRAAPIGRRRCNGIRINDDDMSIINLTVWESGEALYEYMYKGACKNVLPALA
jgi:hypothetical protein